MRLSISHAAPLLLLLLTASMGPATSEDRIARPEDQASHHVSRHRPSVIPACPVSSEHRRQLCDPSLPCLVSQEKEKGPVSSGGWYMNGQAADGEQQQPEQASKEKGPVSSGGWYMNGQTADGEQPDASHSSTTADAAAASKEKGPVSSGGWYPVGGGSWPWVAAGVAVAVLGLSALGVLAWAGASGLIRRRGPGSDPTLAAEQTAVEIMSVALLEQEEEAAPVADGRGVVEVVEEV